MLTTCEGGKDYAACPFSPPEEGAILAPWVKLEFLGEGSTITVGNKSSPATENTAVIKSFELGATDALDMKVEIHDQEGGSFITFMEGLVKDLCDSFGIEVKVTFGWTKSFCTNGCESQTQVLSSCAYFAWPMSVETNFTQGKFIYTITLKDKLTPSIDNQKIPDVKGDDGNKMYLTDAIRSILMDTENAPSVSSVQFLKRTGPDTTTEILFRDYDLDMKDDGSQTYKDAKEAAQKKGPKGTWDLKLRDKLSAVKDWLSERLTDEGKAIIPGYNPCDVLGGEVIYWERSEPLPNGSWDTFPCLDTFVVNGGKDSRVLEFNPRISWPFAQLGVGGNMPSFGPAGALDPGNAKPGVPSSADLVRKDPCNKYAGSESSISVSNEMQEQYKKEADKVASDGQSSQMVAMNFFFNSISADLRIIGDPKYRPLYVKGSTVAIIFINPFYIFKDNSDCGDWLAKPVCNEVLSNRGWVVESINHKIQEGSYVTTLNLKLLAPGVDIDRDKPLGADPMGWKPKN